MVNTTVCIKKIVAQTNLIGTVALVSVLIPICASAITAQQALQTVAGQTNAYNVRGGICGSILEGVVHTEVTNSTNDFKMGDYGQSASGSLNAAQTIAYCYQHRHTMSQAEAYTNVGNLLAMSAIADKEMGSPLSMSGPTAVYAAAMLRVAQPDSIILKTLTRDGLLGYNSPKPGVPTAMMTATQAVRNYLGNPMAFKHRYNGKTLTITGKISQIISEAGNSAEVVVNGEPWVRKNNLSFDDEVGCFVQPAQSSTLMSMDKGDEVSMRGVFDTGNPLYKATFMSGVVLFGCHISR
ncbi:MAG: hypothetical protein ACYCS8_01590 [Acidithiobacillus sp.]